MISRSCLLDPKIKKPDDCFICASRPCLVLNKINITCAHFFCEHEYIPAEQHFRPSVFYKTLNVFVTLILVGGVINRLQQINTRLVTNDVLVIIEAVFYVSTILVNMLCLAKTKGKMTEYHALIMIIKKRKYFEMDNILSSEKSHQTYRLLMGAIVLTIFEQVISCSVTIIRTEHFTFSFVTRMVAIHIVVVTNVSIGLYVMQILRIYENAFESLFMALLKCVNEMKANIYHVEVFNVFDFKAAILKRSYVETLKKYQRLYMSLVRNFKLTQIFLNPFITIYCLAVLMLLIGYGFYAVMYLQEQISLQIFDKFVVGKSIVVVIIFSFFVLRMQHLSEMGQDVLSTLFKFPISKLSPMEAAQMENIITILVVQKPTLTGSDMFIVDAGLLSAVLGIVVTYVLVALQFHAIWYKN